MKDVNLESVKVEADRVRRHLEDAILELAAEDGNPRMFSMALSRAAYEMHVEMFPNDGIEPLLSTISTWQRMAEGGGRNVS